MLYDFDFYPLYYRPRYYSSYTLEPYDNPNSIDTIKVVEGEVTQMSEPDYYIADRYPYYYSNYTPLYPSVYATTRAYLPYRRTCNYLYSIPSYSRTPLYTSIPPSKMLSPIYPESSMYAFTYGSNFNSVKEDLRSAVSKLPEIRRPRASSVPRFARESTCAPLYDSDIDYYRFQRALTARQTSEEPRRHRKIKL